MKFYSIEQSENLFDNLSNDDKKDVKVSNVYTKNEKILISKTSKPKKKKIQNILKRK